MLAFNNKLKFFLKSRLTLLFIVLLFCDTTNQILLKIIANNAGEISFNKPFYYVAQIIHNPYIWFVVNNEDWLIYLLWFGEEGTQDNLDTKKPIIIKDKKRNKILYAGSDGHAPSIYRPLKNIVTPINMTYKTQSKLGDSKYDNYTILFESNDFVYKCKSIPGQSVQVYIDDYYNSGDVDIQKLQGWDKQYYETLLNIKYVEYVNMAEHEITYMGKTVKFTDRQVIDAKYSINPNKPSTIRWNQ